MPYENIRKRLSAGEVILMDGPTGTELERRGAPMDRAAWSAPATLEHDKLLREIHADYIAAGAEVITANTFSSSRLLLADAGLGDRVAEINRRAIAAAQAARDAAPNASDVVVAGSLSHMIPMAEGSTRIDQRKIPSEQQMADAFGELARIFVSSGCDLILLEMMNHPVRARLALEAARTTGLPLWFGVSARRSERGEIVSIHSAQDLDLDEVAKLIRGAGVDAAGAMHTTSELVEDTLDIVRRHFDGPLMAYPDSGYFEMPNWRFVDVISPERFEGFCRRWIENGVQLIGGCCGLTAEHIRAAARARDATAPVGRKP